MSRLRPLPAPEPAGTGRTGLSECSVDPVAVGLWAMWLTTVSGHRVWAFQSGVIDSSAPEPDATNMPMTLNLSCSRDMVQGEIKNIKVAKSGLFNGSKFSIEE
jgi:hypothetical protein